MEYIVEKEFLDRFDSMRHCKPGESHVPHNAERAHLLIERGFISEIEQQKDKEKERGAEQPKAPRQSKAKDQRVIKDGSEGEGLLK